MKTLSLRKIRRAVVALFASLVILFTAFPVANVQAAGVTASISNQVSIKMNNLVTSWNKNPVWNYGGGWECAAFSKYVFNNLYGHSDGYSLAANKKTSFRSFSGVAYSTSSELLNAIKRNAAPGDAIRIKYLYYNSKGELTEKSHIMNIMDVNSSGKITVAESNYAYGKHNKAQIKSYTISNLVNSITRATVKNGKFYIDKKAVNINLVIIHSTRSEMTYKDFSCNGGFGVLSTFRITEIKNKVTFSNYTVGSITKNNAVPKCRISYTGTKIAKVAIYVGTSKTNMKLVASDNISHSKNPFDAWYNLKTEGKMTLKSNTTYYYQFVAYYSGNKVAAKSDIKSFKTK